MSDRDRIQILMSKAEALTVAGQELPLCREKDDAGYWGEHLSLMRPWALPVR